MSSPPDQHADLDRSLVSGIAWTAAAKYGAQIIQWALTLIVARILLPEDYGLFGIAWVAVGLILLINEGGLGLTVVSLRELTKEQIAQLNSVALMFGIGASLLACALAWPFESFFNMPGLMWVLIGLSPLFPIIAMRTVSEAVLQRDLKFRFIALAEAGMAVTNNVMTLVMALLGFGYWSFVIGHLSGQTLRTALVLGRHWSPYAAARMEDLKSTLVFMLHLVGNRIAWFFQSKSDIGVTGFKLGQTATGHFAMAHTLASMPLDKIASLISRVTPAFFSRVQDDAAGLRRYFLRLTEVLAVTIIPVSVGIALVADDFVPVVLGPNWLPAVNPLRLLALSAGWRAVAMLFQHVLVIKKDTLFAMKMGWLITVVLFGAFIVGAGLGEYHDLGKLAVINGITGIALVWLLVHPMLSLPLYRRALSHMAMPVRQYFGALFPAVSSAAIMAAAVLVTKVLDPSLPAAVRLALETLVGVLAYPASMIVFHRQRLAAFMETLKMARSKPATTGEAAED